MHDADLPAGRPSGWEIYHQRIRDDVQQEQGYFFFIYSINWGFGYTSYGQASYKAFWSVIKDKVGRDCAPAKLIIDMETACASAFQQVVDLSMKVSNKKLMLCNFTTYCKNMMKILHC